MSAVEGMRADIVWNANTGVVIGELGELGDVYHRTTGAMSDDALRLAAAQERLNKAIVNSGPESRAAVTATIAYRNELAALATEADAAAAALARQQAVAVRAAKVAADTQLQNTLAAARTVGHTLTTYVSTPTALIGAIALHMGLQFEDSMRLIQTQAGASADELQAMTQGVLQLTKSGQSFGQTANDMSKGLFSIESEGIRGADALQVLRVAAAGAAVGQTSLAETSDALTSVMKVYGLTANQAAGAMATMNAAVGAGKLHMEDLNAALSTKFLPTAKQLGITLPQALAALDVFTKAGIPAQVAANNLTTAFIKFLTPTKAAKTALDELGLSSKALGNDLEQGGLPAALADLVRGYQQLQATQGKVTANQAIFQAFGGSRSGAPILALVQQYESYLQGLKQVQEQSNPATFWNNVAETMNLPSQKIRDDVAKITASMIELGTAIAPVAADIAGAAAKIGDAFAQLPGPVKDYVGVIIGLLAVGGPLILAVAATVKAIQTIGKAFTPIPAQAAPPIAATEAELAGLRTAAAETAATLETVGPAAAAGAAGATAELGVVEGAAGGALAEVSALRIALLGLGGLAIAPIVIPIIYEIFHKSVNLTKTDQPGSSLSLIGRGVYEDDQGRYYQYRGIGKGYGYALITPKEAAQLGAKVPGINEPKFTSSAPPIVRGTDSPSRFPPITKPTTSGAGSSQALTGLQKIQLAISAAEVAQARGDKGAQAQLVAALNEQIAYDERYEKIQEDLIRRHVGNVAQHAKILEGLRSDEASARSEIASATKKGATSESARLTPREDQLTTELQNAQSAAQNAKTLKGLTIAEQQERKAEQLLIAFYEREAHDTKLTATERSAAQKKARDARDALAQIGADDHATRYGFQLDLAKEAVAAAEKGSAAYDTAIAAEKKLLEKEIAYEKARAHNAKLSLQARRDAIAAELAARQELAGLGGTTAAGLRGEAEAEFLSSFRDIVSKYAPNAFPAPADTSSGKTQTHGYETVHELRQIKNHVAKLNKSSQFPASSYSLATVGAVGG